MTIPGITVVKVNAIKRRRKIGKLLTALNNMPTSVLSQATLDIKNMRALFME
jgi:hypothetical protein